MQAACRTSRPEPRQKISLTQQKARRRLRRRAKPSHGVAAPVAVSTTTDPVMCGCSEQKYSKVPGVVNVKENLSSVSSAFERKAPADVDVTVWGMSSSLVQVTVVPAFTVIRCGAKVKLSIFTSSSAARAAAGSADASARRSAAANAPRNKPGSFMSLLSELSLAAAGR